MATPRRLIHVWIEGLYERFEPMGIAWAFKNLEEEFEGTKLRLDYNVDGCEEYGPDCAELQAFIHALKTLPSKSAVVVHSGSQSMIRWMEWGRDAFEIRQNEKWLAVPPFRKSFEDALSHVDRMISVTFQYVRKNNEGQTLVKALAEEALWPSEEEDA